MDTTNFDSTSDAPGGGTPAGVCALVVTYNPDLGLKSNILALLPQVDQLIIIDNHSFDGGRATIREMASVPKVEVIWNARNEGIAAALNKGIRRALDQHNYKWIATFDQDSRVSEGFMDAMFKAYQSCPFRERVALVGPHYIYEGTPAMEDPDLKSVHHFEEVNSTMTSGNLLDPRVLAVCGFFDESFFIDYVDHEYCLRLRRNGFRIIEASRADITHRLGSRTPHRLLTREVVTANYPPTRRYYNSRNRVRVYRMYLLTETPWIAADMYMWVKDVIKLVLFEHDRKEKLKSIFKGIWDAINGKGGPLPQSAQER